MAVKFYKSENQVPLEMHKVRMIQKLSLLPVEDRLKKIQEAGNNTFLLQNKDIYMVALRENGQLIGYYEKHEYRNAETMNTYDLFA